MTIAVDFDGTLCSECYPNIGEPNVGLITLLRSLSKRPDVKLILWTCRSDSDLDKAVAWCTEQDLTFDAINDNLPENIAKYNNNSRKINADIYIDDKCVDCSSVLNLQWLLRRW